jgi:hypothetical protein
MIARRLLHIFGPALPRKALRHWKGRREAVLLFERSPDELSYRFRQSSGRSIRVPLASPASWFAVDCTTAGRSGPSSGGGALSSPDGRIDVSWSHEWNGRLELRWIETGGPPVQTPTHEGFGGRIIKQLAGQLKDGPRYDWRAEGLDCTITVQT